MDTAILILCVSAVGSVTALLGLLLRLVTLMDDRAKTAQDERNRLHDRINHLEEIEHRHELDCPTKTDCQRAQNECRLRLTQLEQQVDELRMWRREIG